MNNEINTPMPRFLKVAEVARRLNVSKSLVYRMIADGELPAVRMCKGTLRVRGVDLEAYIQSHLK